VDAAPAVDATWADPRKGDLNKENEPDERIGRT
jgi:hypothetical protein